MKTNIAIASFSVFADGIDVIGIATGVPATTALHPHFALAAPMGGRAGRE